MLPAFSAARRAPDAGPHRDHADGLQLWIGQHLVVIRIGALNPKTLGHLGKPGGRARAERVHLHVGDGCQRLAVLLAEPPQTDHPILDRLHPMTSCLSTDRTRSRPGKACPPIPRPTTEITAPSHRQRHRSCMSRSERIPWHRTGMVCGLARCRIGSREPPSALTSAPVGEHLSWGDEPRAASKAEPASRFAWPQRAGDSLYFALWSDSPAEPGKRR